MMATGGLVGNAVKSKGRASSVTVAATVHFPPKYSLTVPLNVYLPPTQSTDTE